MTLETEERFQRIERNLEQITAATQGLIAQAQSNQQALAGLIASVNAYVDDSRERTKRLEDNLDALIRAITAEHSNGKGKA
jgi:hypothetical protein